MSSLDPPSESSADDNVAFFGAPGDELAADPPPDPRIPTGDELDAFHPATDLFVAFLDEVSSRTLGRPLRPRVKVTPTGLLRGEIDLLKIELPAYAVAGLILDRFIIRAERVRIIPGFPPTFAAGPVRFSAVVGQDNLDTWTRSLRLPVRLRLTDEGVVSTAGIGGVRVTEVLTELDVSGRFLRLRPTRANLLGRTTPIARFLRGYLPLPQLPREARLESVDHRSGELVARFAVDEFRQPLTPDVQDRLVRMLNLPLPGLRR